MASRSVHSLVPIAGLFLLACQPTATALSEAEIQAIQSVSDQLIQHTRAKDWDAFSALYTDDAIVMPPNQPAVRGRGAIRDFLAAFPPLTAFALINDTIVGLGDLAYVTGRYRMTLAVEGTPTDSGKFVEIRRKQPDGSWKLAVDIFNSSVPLPPPAKP